jgi:hypothetical protein
VGDLIANPLMSNLEHFRGGSDDHDRLRSSFGKNKQNKPSIKTNKPSYTATAI